MTASDAASIQAVVFDVDGVLVDSLSAHLAICRDKSREFGLGLVIPDADGFRALVRRGVPISPMKQFFLAVGFPAEAAQRADADYRREFAARYVVPAFPDTTELLGRLRKAGVILGVVTSNTLKNVSQALGQSMSAFDSRCVYAADKVDGLQKGEALRIIADTLALEPGRVIFVGDQPADLRAARQAGTQFLAVLYGWGFAPGDFEPSAATLSAIGDYVLPKQARARR